MLAFLTEHDELEQFHSQLEGPLRRLGGLLPALHTSYSLGDEVTKERVKSLVRANLFFDDVSPDVEEAYAALCQVICSALEIADAQPPVLPTSTMAEEIRKAGLAVPIFNNSWSNLMPNTSPNQHMPELYVETNGVTRDADETIVHFQERVKASLSESNVSGDGFTAELELIGEHSEDIASCINELNPNARVHVKHPAEKLFPSEEELLATTAEHILSLAQKFSLAYPPTGVPSHGDDDDGDNDDGDAGDAVDAGDDQDSPYHPWLVSIASHLVRIQSAAAKNAKADTFQNETLQHALIGPFLLDTARVLELNHWSMDYEVLVPVSLISLGLGRIRGEKWKKIISKHAFHAKVKFDVIIGTRFSNVQSGLVWPGFPVELKATLRKTGNSKTGYNLDVSSLTVVAVGTIVYNLYWFHKVNGLPSVPEEENEEDGAEETEASKLMKAMSRFYFITSAVDTLDSSDGAEKSLLVDVWVVRYG